MVTLLARVGRWRCLPITQSRRRRQSSAQPSARWDLCRTRLFYGPRRGAWGKRVRCNCSCRRAPLRLRRRFPADLWTRCRKTCWRMRSRAPKVSAASRPWPSPRRKPRTQRGRRASNLISSVNSKTSHACIAARIIWKRWPPSAKSVVRNSTARDSSSLTVEPVLFQSQQGLQRHAVVLDDRFDDDVTEIFLDTDVPLKNAFDHFLIGGDVGNEKLQKIVIAAADEMAFRERAEAAELSLELDEVVSAMLIERDLGKNNQIVGALRQIQRRMVTDYIDGFFQPFDPRKAGAW